MRSIGMGGTVAQVSSSCDWAWGGTISGLLVCDRLGCLRFMAILFDRVSLARKHMFPIQSIPCCDPNACVWCAFFFLVDRAYVRVLRRQACTLPKQSALCFVVYVWKHNKRHSLSYNIYTLPDREDRPQEKVIQ